MIGKGFVKCAFIARYLREETACAYSWSAGVPSPKDARCYTTDA